MYRKRHRTTFCQQQLTILEEAFKQNIYPSPSLREAIALQTNLDTSRVQVWFQNRRAKHKRQVSQVNQVIRNFTYSGDPVVVPVVPAAALEAALSGDDFCLADQIIVDSCANDLTSCYEDLYDPLNHFQQQQQQLHNHLISVHGNSESSNNNHINISHQQQPGDPRQQQQQLHLQQQQQPQEQQQQEQCQQSQGERQNHYYNYYRQQLKSTMTEFLQS